MAAAPAAGGAAAAADGTLDERRSRAFRPNWRPAGGYGTGGVDSEGLVGLIGPILVSIKSAHTHKHNKTKDGARDALFTRTEQKTAGAHVGRNRSAFHSTCLPFTGSAEALLAQK